MLILAMDQSTARGSLALLRDDRLLAETAWMDDRRHSQQLFDRLPRLLADAEVVFSQLDCLAVGLGPGSYTGLRIALAAALGLALPDRRPAHGVSSAEALAAETLSEIGAPSVLVIGDARRGQLWARAFAPRGDRCAPTTSWLLCPPDSLAGAGAAAWVTPDWDRLGALLGERVPAGVRLIGEARWPSARAVGQAAWRRIRDGAPSEPLAPIYLHAAVGSPRAPAPS